MYNKAKVISVYDGDSITCDVTYPIIKNMRLVNTEKIRIYGIDTPELRDKNLEIKALAYEVRDYVRQALFEGRIIDLLLIDDNDKYGRLLAYVLIDGNDFGAHLIIKGYAQEYYGGTKKAWIIQ